MDKPNVSDEVVFDIERFAWAYVHTHLFRAKFRDAEDIVQETVFIVTRKIAADPSLAETKRRLRGFTRGVAHNIMLRFATEACRHPELLADFEPDAPDPIGHLISEEEHEHISAKLWEILNRICPEETVERKILIEHDVRGLSFRRIAELVLLSKSRVHEIHEETLGRLRRALVQELPQLALAG